MINPIEQSNTFQWKRICPSCQKEIIYMTYSGYYWGNRNNSNCFSCGAKMSAAKNKRPNYCKECKKGTIWVEEKYILLKRQQTKLEENDRWRIIYEIPKKETTKAWFGITKTNQIFLDQMFHECCLFFAYHAEQVAFPKILPMRINL